MHIGYPAPRIFKEGDLGIVNGVSRKSSAIKFFGTQKDEPYSFASHIFTMVNRDMEIEALWRTVIRPINIYTDSGCGIVVVRNKCMTDEMRQDVLQDVIHYHNMRYGVGKIVANAIDTGLFRDKRIVRRLCRDAKLPICSLMPAMAYNNQGIQFKGKQPDSCMPDDISDHTLVDTDWVVMWASTRAAYRQWIRSVQWRLKGELQIQTA